MDIVDKWIRDHSLESISISDEELKRTYFGSWEVDKRTSALHDRLKQYYELTPDSVSNREAMRHWREFKQWAVCGGYSNEEINYAKRNANYRI